MSTWIHCRESITIGAGLDRKIAAGQAAGRVTPGDTLLLMARVVKQPATHDASVVSKTMPVRSVFIRQ